MARHDKAIAGRITAISRSNGVRGGACASVSTSRRARPPRSTRSSRASSAPRRTASTPRGSARSSSTTRLTLLALAARATRRLELGSWVVPAPLRHPAVLAQQALTVQAASGGRLVLGVGVSHEEVVARRFGVPFERPARHMREYLELLVPLLAGAARRARGRALPRLAPARQPRRDSAACVLLAALGPAMLRLAGAAADGAAIWLGSRRFPRAVRNPVPARGCARRRTPDAPHRLRLPDRSHPRPDRRARERGARCSRAARSYPPTGACSSAAVCLGPPTPRSSATRTPWRARSRRLAELGVTDLTRVLFAVAGDPEAPARTQALLAELARAGAL